jgi:hypothetical protein
VYKRIWFLILFTTPKLPLAKCYRKADSTDTYEKSSENNRSNYSLAKRWMPHLRMDISSEWRTQSKIHTKCTCSSWSSCEWSSWWSFAPAAFLAWSPKLALTKFLNTGVRADRETLDTKDILYVFVKLSDEEVINNFFDLFRTVFVGIELTNIIFWRSRS